MKAILTAAAAAFVVAGAFAQVQTGEPSNGSSLGVTPPPSTSSTTDTSRLATDCDKVAADQRSHQAGGAQLGSAGCGSRTTTMGASGATTATTAATTGSTYSTTNNTASTDTAGSTDMAAADTSTTSKHKAKKARRAARADRG